MSPKKKGYKNRLPTVLPPAPRAAPEQDATWPPRSAHDATHARAIAAGHGARRTTRPAEPDPVEQRSPSLGVVLALALAGLALVGIAGVVVVPRLLDDGPDRPPAADDAGAPAGLVADTSYVVSRVLPNGDVVVRQRIRADAPSGSCASRCRGCRVPRTCPPGRSTSWPTATRSRAGDDHRRRRRPTRSPLRRTADPLPARPERSSSATRPRAEPGDGHHPRGPVRAQVERETRVVRAAEVLALACSRSVEEAPVPCGEPDGDGRWLVELTGGRVADRVMAQVTLG